MTVLITGAGMIGRLSAAQLRAQGEDVMLVDVSPRPPEELDGVSLELCDVTDFARLDDLVARHQVTSIVHTAALLSTAIRRDPLAGIRVNTIGTANVLEIARRRGLARVVIASSTTVMYSAFGSLPAAPIPEDFPYRIVSERPASIYAVTKVASEHLALAYASLYDLGVVVLRYGAVLGAGAEAATSVPGKLLSCLLEAGRSGSAARLDDPILLWNGHEEFIDARDCAAANVAALRAPAPTQRVYNIATGQWFSLDEFIEVVRQRYPSLSISELRLPAGGFAAFPHVRPAPSDVSAARRELGFSATHSLADTVAHFAESL
ncbi:NAD-dependent epimerase/dehydratase family protein [Paraburkholderia xenovorans]|uniref:NAD-dependent epimerase/dehydratase family protein n=1 Tax=Paraburkholderia xenovorans TaxID=36873 RepID=UPI0015588766|nr:NAD(P)-dependent oxidoreductase [Paraburkholderia xenovorans]NPT38255.1 NAD-dependent epimerase/dehydratase family protein [Paraburkholderia xenovorans]